uniref:Zinc finger CW-type and PWWP domain containing 2 n=1 Tax=Gadus morhua TaxID=8049 RepID=A0A8C5A1K3_GADMO
MAHPPSSVVPGTRRRKSPSTTKNVKSHNKSSHVEENQIWVQCETPRCLKWRLISQVSDVGVRLSTEQSWFCSMNPDPVYSSCAAPQQLLPSVSLLKKHGLDYVYSQIPVGSLVSAKIRGWPWWPAVLSPDPGNGMHLKQDGDGDVHSYHVEFLGNPHSRCWAMAKCVGSYRSIAEKDLRALTKTDRKSCNIAIQEAGQIKNMSCEERLLLCHFQPNYLLIKAEKLMWDIEDLIKQFDSNGGSRQKQKHSKDQSSWLCQGGIEEDGDALIVEGFRFESAASTEELRSLGSQPGPSNL